jgi:hypothetical protein
MMRALPPLAKVLELGAYYSYSDLASRNHSCRSSRAGWHVSSQSIRATNDDWQRLNRALRAEPKPT